MEEKIVETLEGFVVMMNLSSNFSLKMSQKKSFEIEILNNNQRPTFMVVYSINVTEIVVRFQLKRLDTKQQKINRIVRENKFSKEIDDSFSNVNITALLFNSTDEFLSFMTTVLIPKLETI